MKRLTMRALAGRVKQKSTEAMNNGSDKATAKLFLGLTTVETAEQAEELARAAVESGLVACAQVDAPITSHFSWEGRMENAVEYRLLFKFLGTHQSELESWLEAHHPYDTPEWIVLSTAHTAEKYLQWAREVTK